MMPDHWAGWHETARIAAALFGFTALAVAVDLFVFFAWSMQK